MWRHLSQQGFIICLLALQALHAALRESHVRLRTVGDCTQARRVTKTGNVLPNPQP